MANVPELWRFNFEDDEVCLRDLSWVEARRLFHTAVSGVLAGHAGGEWVWLEFDADHAEVVVMGRDKVIRRADFSDKRLHPCPGCDIRISDRTAYLSQFFSRPVGFRLFVAVLSRVGLPTEVPDQYPGRQALPGFEELTGRRALEWRPTWTDGG